MILRVFVKKRFDKSFQNRKICILRASYELVVIMSSIEHAFNGRSVFGQKVFMLSGVSERQTGILWNINASYYYELSDQNRIATERVVVCIWQALFVYSCQNISLNQSVIQSVSQSVQWVRPNSIFSSHSYSPSVSQNRHGHSSMLWQIRAETDSTLMLPLLYTKHIFSNVVFFCMYPVAMRTTTTGIFHFRWKREKGRTGHGPCMCVASELNLIDWSTDRGGRYGIIWTVILGAGWLEWWKTAAVKESARCVNIISVGVRVWVMGRGIWNGRNV